VKIDIQKNLALVKESISLYSARYGRNCSEITLLAVSKGQSNEKIRQAILSGQHRFGENYLQEALPKIIEFSQEALEWHFIGPIQQNKTKKIAENFHWVHGVCDLKIAVRLNDQRPHTLPPLNICLQVNVSEEKTKSGLVLDEVLFLCNECQKLSHLKLRGLMTIPAQKSAISDQRKEFRKLSNLFCSLKQKGFELDTLSMGMSNDLEAAIAEGSTLVRIGRGIFGEREH